jgi:diguanylate cyclase (GGDEF)-like protein/PAS domain S-box-containing protein
MASAPAPRLDDNALWAAVPGLLLRLGVDGTLLGSNAMFRACIGADAEAMGGHGWDRALDDGSRLTLHAALLERRDFRLYLELTRVDGCVARVEWTGRWLADSAEYICLLHDVTAATETHAAAHAQTELFRLLADNVPVQIAYYRASDLTCQFANKAYARAFGHDERAIVGLPLAEVIGADAALHIEPEVHKVTDDGLAAAYERALVGPDGQARWIEVNLLPHLDVSGRSVGAFVLIADITKHRQAELALRESEERLTKFMQATAEGIVFHRDGVIDDANPALCELIGYTLEEVRGQAPTRFVAPEQVARVAAIIASGRDTAYESVILDKQGRRIAVEFIIRMIVRNGEPMRMAIVRDIRDRQAALARIHHLAHHDPLTGLPNRNFFMEQLEHSMLAARAQHSRLGLLFIDLDHFKRVNDSLGHMVGDTMLRTLAARITGALRGTDVVARFGGDEFMVLVPGLPAADEQRDDVRQVAQKLIAVIESPVHAEGRPLTVTPSIGIALYPGDGETPIELIEHADSAMYRAKARGGANFEFFDPAMATSAYAALVIEGELGHALERGEFELFFQPQVRASDGGLVGAEALIRWNHPVRGLLLPDEFIPVAEPRRLMLPIGQWVLQEAARCAARWHAMGLNVAPVAVNLSTVQFHSIGFIDAVAQLLPRDGIGAGLGLIELELTERMLMDDLPEVKKRLMRLKALGLRISVDDFGTGYSSLGHLKELPIDKVKIDRSFIQDLPDNQDSAAIARAIVQMGHSLGITVIAEGVESEAQGRFLGELGCDELQGLWVGAPMPKQQFEAWVVARRAAALT